MVFQWPILLFVTEFWERVFTAHTRARSLQTFKIRRTPLCLRVRITLSAIEGFHDAVRTPYALRPGRHVGFFWNNKICFNFVSIVFEKIKLTVSERTYIIYPMV